jgi:ABC-type transporter Mla maintaining outer membrane lipid asymmetry permease subunit MlaE
MKIVEKLREIGQDKLLHFISNAIIAWAISFILMFFINPYISILCGFVFSSFIAWAKEYIWDLKMNKGVYNNKDILFGIIGAFLESLSLLLMI